jgi:serine/threonine-protein kinase
MATVYLARDLKHGRPVALKVLRPEVGTALGAERFLREIRLTATLQHPNILPLLDSGAAAGLFYYVMPYVEGESLRQRLERDGQLPLDEAIRLGQEAADALDYAHAQGVIHRDIKPENLLLSRGHVLVADFGIALAVTEATGGRLTGTGLSLGTPAYMSPEQATADRQLDARTDQYSLACVLYEMLAGEPPYTGPTAQAIIAKRLSEPVPRLGTLREVPPAVEAAVTRALAKSPADRFISTRTFAKALTTDLAAVPSPVKPPRSRPSRLMLPLSGLAVAGVALAGFLLRGATPRSGEPAGVLRQRQQTFSGQASDPALSPDGQSLAYVRERRELVLEPVNGGSPTTLVQAESWIFLPRWSPDGQWVYFTMLRNNTDSPAIYRVPGRGGTPHKVVQTIGLVDFSPDGHILVRAVPGELVFHDAVTGVEQRRIDLPGDPDSAMRFIEDFPLEAAWSPDGRWIASDNTSGEIVVTSADGGSSTVVARDRLSTIRWAPHSDALYYLSQARGGYDILRLPIDTRSGRAAGEERTRLSGIPIRRRAEVFFDLTRSGRTLAYINGAESQHLWTFRLEPGRDTAVAQRLSKDSRAYDWPALSYDGEWIAVMQHGLDKWLEGNFFIVPAAGGEFTPLTIGPGEKGSPGWSPDGRQLALVLTDSAGSRVVLTDRSGRRLSVGSTAPTTIGFFRISWSADGHSILYLARWGRTLVVLDLRQSTERLSMAPDSNGLWLGGVLSPDGREIVAAEVRRWGERFRIARGAVGSDRWVELDVPAGDNMPLVWRRDGWIYLFNDRQRDRVSHPAREASIWRLRPDGSRRELVAWLPVECRFGFVSMSGDARRVACAALEQEADIWLVPDFEEPRE